MILTIDSDPKKGWIIAKGNPFTVTIFNSLPGTKKFRNGILYFEMSRQNVEHLQNIAPDAVWKGPIKDKIGFYAEIRERERKSREQKLRDLPPVTDFPFKTTPYEHQLKAFSLARGREYFGYFMEQGTGKTKVMLDDSADIFLHGGENGGIDTLVVIAPNGVHRQWVTEQIPTHLSDAVKYKAAYTSANPTREEAQMMEEMLAFSGGLRILAVHTEYLSSKKGKAFLYDFLHSCNAMGLVDESTRFKEPSSNRTKTLLELKNLFKYRRIATGTPVTQGVQDLYTQLAFLSEDILGFTSFYSFRNHFCKMGGFQNKKIVGTLNEEELISKLDAHTFRVLASECLDLPERVYIRREIPLTDEQTEKYAQLKKKFLLELESGEIVTVKMAMTRMIRLQQIANGFLWIRQKKDPMGNFITPEIHEEYKTNRVQATVDILEESRADQKFIIWLKFEGDYELLAPALRKAGITFTSYTGNLSTADAETNLEAFKTDPNIKVLLSTPKKGGIGLNLTVASNMIWFSRDFSLEAELQADARIYRMGQEQRVVVYTLVAPKTVDEHIERIQAGKLATATSLVDYKDFI